MEILAIIIGFAIFCVLGLIWAELRRFVDHVIKPPPPQMVPMMYDRGPHPSPPKPKQEEPDAVGFGSTRKKDKK